MTDSKHTPGPWEVKENRSSVVHGAIAVYAAGFPGTLICDGIWGRSIPESDANARLIAAAPDLLTVLVQAVEASGFSLCGPTDGRAAEHGEPAWVCNARAAIAKAEGN